MTSTTSRLLFPVATTVAAAAAGASLGLAERNGLGLMVVGIAVSWACLRTALFRWDVFVLTLSGCLILGYGFVNVPAAPGVPLPLPDALLIVLALRTMIGLRIERPLVLPLAWAAIFVAIASIRLLIDVPVWGGDALRDYSLAVELLALPVGWAMLESYGLDRWRRALTWIFLLLLVYLWVYPWRDTLAAVAPAFGLQRETSLLGDYQAAGSAAIAGLLFFALLRPLGRGSLALSALFVPPLLLLQYRGLYLALPAVVLLIFAIASSRVGAVLRRRLAMLTLVAALGIVGLGALLSTLSVKPTGRLAQVSPGFVLNQLAAVRGEPGPQSAGVELRKRWIRGVVSDLNAKPSLWVTGLGLGPDLAQGFRYTNGVLVRKPHNDYLETLGRLGVGGLVALLAVLAAATVPIVRKARYAGRDEAAFLWWIIGASATFLLIAATQPMLAYAYTTIPLFSFLGAGLALSRMRVPSS